MRPPSPRNRGISRGHRGGGGFGQGGRYRRQPCSVATGSDGPRGLRKGHQSHMDMEQSLEWVSHQRWKASPLLTGIPEQCAVSCGLLVGSRAFLSAADAILANPRTSMGASSPLRTMRRHKCVDVSFFLSPSSFHRCSP